jgi:RimJ/RimL family protein N-acetyltransferase
MDKIIETPRLHIRQFTKDDASFIYQLLNDPSFIENIGDKKIKNNADAVQYLEQGPLESYQSRGFGFNLVALKSTGQAIGMCGLVKRDELESPDLGYAYLSAFQGQGFATEAASAILTELSNSKRLKSVSAIASPANTASNHVIIKAGFKFQQVIQFKGEDANLYAYAP